MTPIVLDTLTQDFEVAERETRTFRLDPATNTITGFVDGKEAVKQAVYMMLNTERFVHAIFSWNYGIEKRKLIGKPTATLNAYIAKAITETLMQDTRILSVGNFAFTTSGNTIAVTFDVGTSEGAIETGWEFNGAI